LCGITKYMEKNVDFSGFCKIMWLLNACFLLIDKFVFGMWVYILLYLHKPGNSAEAIHCNRLSNFPDSSYNIFKLAVSTDSSQGIYRGIESRSDRNSLLTEISQLTDWQCWHVRSFLHISPTWYNMIYLLTAIGLSPGGSTHLHTNTT
jgi:hypothetical protein